MSTVTIESTRFGSLEIAWRFNTANLGPTPEFRFQSTPLVVDGVIYRVLENLLILDGERLIWEAQPIPAIYARSAWPIAIFGLFFGGFAAFWIAAAGGMLWFSDGPKPRETGVVAIFNCFPLFGLPFLLVGLAMITAPIWMRRMAARVVYGVTSRRAISCSKFTSCK